MTYAFTLALCLAYASLAYGDDTDACVTARHDSLVIPVGDPFDLTCVTKSPWALCSWRTPVGGWCDRLGSTRYETACQSSDNIKFKVENVRW